MVVYVFTKIRSPRHDNWNFTTFDRLEDADSTAMQNNGLAFTQAFLILTKLDEIDTARTSTAERSVSMLDPNWLR